MVQIGNHGGARFGFVADTADGVIQGFAVFALAGFDMAGHTISAEDGLPVGFGDFQRSHAVGLGLGRQYRWQDGDF